MTTLPLRPLPATRDLRIGENRASRMHVWLLTVLAGAVHWSTAAAELAAAAIIVRFAFSLRHVEPTAGARTRAACRLRLALLLWGVYVLSVCISLVSSGELFTSGAGTLWRPLLFLAILLTPMSVQDLIRAGSVYLISGLAAGVTLLLINVAAGYQSPAIVFTGLTTFADLTALLVIITVATVAFHRTSPHLPVGIAAAGMLSMVILFWTAARAPVAIIVIAGGIMIAVSRPRLLVLWGILMGSLFILAPPGLRARTAWVMRGNPIDRYIVWEEGGRHLTDVPLFGSGPNSYALTLSPAALNRFVNRPPASWHNDFLQTALDYGPVAATAWGGLVLLSAVAACRVVWACRRDGRRFARAIPGMACLSLTALGLVGSVVTTAILGSVYWTVMGLALREWTSSDSGSHPTPTRGTPSYRTEDL